MEKFCDTQLGDLDILLQDLNKVDKTSNVLKTKIPPEVIYSLVERSDSVSKELKKLVKKLAVYRKGSNYKTGKLPSHT